MFACDVCIRQASVKVNTGQLLKRVLAGKLLAYHPQRTIFPLRAMWFAAKDVESLDDTIKEEHGWFTKSEAKAYLNVSWLTMTLLIESGFLCPEMKKCNFQLKHNKGSFILTVYDILKVSHVAT